jgi:tellurite resistance protein TerC
MLLLDLYKVPIWLSLAVIATTITVAVGWSLRATRCLEDAAAEELAPDAGDRLVGDAEGNLR